LETVFVETAMPELLADANIHNHVINIAGRLTKTQLLIN
jgi:hypothetical protein